MSQSVITLNSGWNWISFSVITNDMSINSYLNNISIGQWTDGDIIKTQSTTSTYNGIWSTETGIINIELNKMYKIKVQNQITLYISGRIPFEEEAKQTISGNNSWNWLSYPLDSSKSVNEILSNETENDILKSQTKFTLFSNNDWRSYGNLDEFEKNKGYLLKYFNDLDLNFDDLPTPSDGLLYTVENIDTVSGELDLIVNTNRINQTINQNGRLRGGQVKLNFINITSVVPTTFTKKYNDIYNPIYNQLLPILNDPVAAHNSTIAGLSNNDNFHIWNSFKTNTFSNSNTVYFIDLNKDGFIIDEILEKIKFKVFFDTTETPTVNNGIIFDSTVSNNGSGEEYREIPSTYYSHYRITINMDGDYSIDDSNLFEEAANVWKNIITSQTMPNEIEDMIINVSLEELASNILGSAGPTNYITNSDGKNIAIKGVMIFNTLNWETQKNTFKPDGRSEAFYTAVHEMGHVIGIGTMWTLNNLTANKSQLNDNPSDDNNDKKYWYIGENAVREYRNYFNNQTFVALPIENNGGPGTELGHPEEGHVIDEGEYVARTYGGQVYPGLEDEIMTGLAESSNTHEYLSKITIGFLEDLGFEVDYTQASKL